MIVLDNINLTVPPASIITVGGHNGAGKTTLLRIAAGMVLPDAGRIEVNGLTPGQNRRAYQSQVSFVSTGGGGLYARMTARQHLCFQSRLDLLPRGIRECAVEREFERLHLEVLDGRRVDRLSMGQRQRLRLAMAMIRDPKVLLLDEPENGLDKEGIAILYGLASDVAQRGGVVVWCSPTSEVAGLEPDRRYMIVGGKLATI